MNELTILSKSLVFRWLPKHLQHLAENIVLKKRNIFFLSINALFRQTSTHTVLPSYLGNNHYVIEDFVPLQRNDNLRIKAERLKVVFELDKHQHIIVKTAYSENDYIDRKN